MGGAILRGTEGVLGLHCLSHAEAKFLGREPTSAPNRSCEYTGRAIAQAERKFLDCERGPRREQSSNLLQQDLVSQIPKGLSCGMSDCFLDGASADVQFDGEVPKLT
jgi:hypothetical protein